MRTPYKPTDVRLAVLDRGQLFLRQLAHASHVPSDPACDPTCPICGMGFVPLTETNPVQIEVAS